jgi:beta-lactam-binding protein with PASTA domain
VPFVVTLPVTSALVPLPRAARAVPDVRGLPLRDAVRSLHTAGFRVQLATGPDGVTSPPAGAIAPAGALVRLLHDN